MEKVKAAMKKLEEEEKRAEMLLKMDERKRPYNSMTETKVSPPPYFSGCVSYVDSGSAWNRVYLAFWIWIQTIKSLLSAQPSPFLRYVQMYIREKSKGSVEILPFIELDSYLTYFTIEVQE